MGINLSLWLYDTEAIPAANRAAAAWNRINDKPSSVAFKNAAGTIQAAQTVRIEFDSRASESESVAGQTAVRKLTIFGVRGHATIADTDMKEGYRFVLNNDQFRIVDVMYTIGEVQATAEATG